MLATYIPCQRRGYLVGHMVTAVLDNEALLMAVPAHVNLPYLDSTTEYTQVGLWTFSSATISGSWKPNTGYRWLNV